MSSPQSTTPDLPGRSPGRKTPTYKDSLKHGYGLRTRMRRIVHPRKSVDLVDRSLEPAPKDRLTNSDSNSPATTGHDRIDKWEPGCCSPSSDKSTELGDKELSKLRFQNQALENHVDWMQWQVDHASWTRKFHVEDSEIEQAFDGLLEKILTWSRNADFRDGGIAFDLQFPDAESHQQLLCRISPWCETKERFEANIGHNPQHKRYLLRGLIARVLCDRIFAPSGEDYWLDAETRSQLKAIEEKVKPKDSDTDNDSISRFHDWRALTVNLLSTSRRTELGLGNVQAIVGDVYQVLGYDASLARKSAEDLSKILQAAVDLSQTLRQQRPSWSIRLPEVKIQDKGKVFAATYDIEEMLDKELDNLTAVASDPSLDVYVYFFITPALLKKGKGNGQHFDKKELVFRKAKVKTITVSR